MTDYTTSWHFSSERREDLTPPKASYGASRRDYGSYTSRELGYDDRTAFDVLGAGSTILRNGLYGGGDLGVGLGGVLGGYGSFEDSNLLTQNAAARMTNYDLGSRLSMPIDHQIGLRSSTGEVLPPEASATLFVDGLPIDCTRREAAHIFRPFIGFKEVRVVHKDAKRAQTIGEKVVLCFVEFSDPRCAATALEALQGYKFDENDPDSYVLRLTFARYPGPRGGGGGGGGGRDRSPYRNRDRSPRRRY